MNFSARFRKKKVVENIPPSGEFIGQGTSFPRHERMPLASNGSSWLPKDDISYQPSMDSRRTRQQLDADSDDDEDDSLTRLYSQTPTTDDRYSIYGSQSKSSKDRYKPTTGPGSSQQQGDSTYIRSRNGGASNYYGSSYGTPQSAPPPRTNYNGYYGSSHQSPQARSDPIPRPKYIGKSKYYGSNHEKPRSAPPPSAKYENSPYYASTYQPSTGKSPYHMSTYLSSKASERSRGLSQFYISSLTSSNLDPKEAAKRISGAMSSRKMDKKSTVNFGKLKEITSMVERFQKNLEDPRGPEEKKYEIADVMYQLMDRKASLEIQVGMNLLNSLNGPPRDTDTYFDGMSV